MNLKKLLADALFLDARVYHYRSCGYDEASAYALASQDLAEQQRASAASAAAMERLEKSREHYRESMAALEERRRKLCEKNPWMNIPLRRSRLSGKMETTCPDRRKPL